MGFPIPFDAPTIKSEPKNTGYSEFLQIAFPDTNPYRIINDISKANAQNDHSDYTRPWSIKKGEAPKS